MHIFNFVNYHHEYKFEDQLLSHLFLADFRYQHVIKLDKKL